MRARSAKIVLCFMALLLLGCATSTMRVSNDGVIVLSDAPAVKFNGSGWSYANLPNPFLLTPDYLTNAMIAVGRLQQGQSLLNVGPTITPSVTIEDVRLALAALRKDNSDLSLEVVKINGRDVVHAVYSDDGKQCEDYALLLNDFVVHVSLIAIPGDYYAAGSKAAYEIVNSIKAQ